jgi:CRISPR-associated protein Csd1
MILQAINDYYQRKQSDPDPKKRLPDFGLEQKEISFVLEIDLDGRLVQLRDTREVVGNKKVGRGFRVPQGVKKTSGVAANLLWGSAEYVLGLEDTKKLEQAREKDKEADYRSRLTKMHQAFCKRIADLPDSAQQDEGLRAVRRFLENDLLAPLAQVKAQANFCELAAAGGVVSLQLQDDDKLICQRPAVMSAALNSGGDDGDAPPGMCLVSGKFAPIQRLHTAIKGVRGAQTSGANIVSFNARAFESYGKTERQGENAPVSKAAAFAYTTALNHLLAKDSAQRIQIGDVSTVFWADKEDELESALANIFGEPARDDPEANTRAVRALYQAVHTGKLAPATDENRFHILGLAPNVARISVRFYHCLPLSALAARIVQHFDDLKLVRGENDAEFPSLYSLLTAVAVQNKADNIPPNLGGAIVDALFAGPDVPYPSLWLNAAVNRCRAEQTPNYLRAAVIKACLNRKIRRSRHTEKEFLPMLDTDNTNTSYRLGRLFAALEKIQEEASTGLNATIRDRYYGAASSTPAAVFTTLLRLKNAHLKKLNIGRATQFEKLLAEVLGAISEFPKHLPLQDQGRFALGYYHQRQAFFTKSNDKQPTTEEQ